MLDKKVFCTLRSSKAIFDAAPEPRSLLCLSPSLKKKGDKPRHGDFRSQQFIFAIKAR